MAKELFYSDAKWSREGVKILLESRGHRWVVDEPESLGGKDEAANPVEYVLRGLASCLGVLISAFSPAFQVELKDFRVHVEGDLDPDGFLGKAPVRTGFQEIRYTIEVESDSPRENQDRLLEHIQKICPVKDTLQGVSVLPLEGVSAL
ncbi:OsmC family protein [Leptospira stimsonii]|uniref:Peroxiredoxin n=1 Tax=Leptospira stimsonii TaxID=2202203 RepID=A0A8B3CWF3_9LEPT|nr:OsmC family protein [Leptospira stimsonii]RHX88504.1 peroxiredoxin [Leptospira stimsonii]